MNLQRSILWPLYKLDLLLHVNNMEIKSASTTNFYGEEISHWILPKIPFKAISLVSLHKIPG